MLMTLSFVLLGSTCITAGVSADALDERDNEESCEMERSILLPRTVSSALVYVKKTPLTFQNTFVNFHGENDFFKKKVIRTFHC